MDFSYESGLALAFVINLVKVIISIAQLTSVRAKNLKHVGLHYSCIQGKYLQRPGHPLRMALYLFYMLFVTPIFSWISVVSAVLTYLWIYAKRQQVPEKVKELQYRLGASLLTKEQVADVLTELGRFHGASEMHIKTSMKDLMHFDPVDSQTELVLENDEYGYASVELDAATKRLWIRSHSGDHLTSTENEYEFKVDGTEVSLRLIKCVTESIDDKVLVKVEDNVVMESNLRDHYKGVLIPYLDEDLRNLKRQVAWGSDLDFRIKYFVLRHGSAMSEFDFRKFMQSEKQRIESGCRSLISEVKAQEGVIKESDDGFVVHYKDETDEAHKARIGEILTEEEWSRRSLTSFEFHHKKCVVAEIDRWLGKEKATQ